MEILPDPSFFSAPCTVSSMEQQVSAIFQVTNSDNVFGLNDAMIPTSQEDIVFTPVEKSNRPASPVDVDQDPNFKAMWQGRDGLGQVHMITTSRPLKTTCHQALLLDRPEVLDVSPVDTNKGSIVVTDLLQALIIFDAFDGVSLHASNEHSVFPSHLEAMLRVRPTIRCKSAREVLRDLSMGQANTASTLQ